jgi:hypothetical protein
LSQKPSMCVLPYRQISGTLKTLTLTVWYLRFSVRWVWRLPSLGVVWFAGRQHFEATRCCHLQGIRENSLEKVKDKRRGRTGIRSPELRA